jgi:hypothetical protein
MESAMITFAALNVNRTTGKEFVGISGALDRAGKTLPIKASVNPGSEGFEVAKELAGLYAAAYPDKSKYPYGFALIAPEGFSVAENKDVFEDDDGNLREGAYRAHGVGGQLSIGEMPPVKVAVDPKAIELLAKYRAARG